MNGTSKERQEMNRGPIAGGLFPFLGNLKTRTRGVVFWYAEHKHAGRALGFFSFIESIFFPVPPDVFLIALVGAKERARWTYYAFVATTWSVIGGIVGYAIGLFLYDAIGARFISLYGLSDKLAYAQTFLLENEFLAIFLAGFTPIPYKVFTLGAGFLALPFVTFLVASLLSRAMRFFAVAYIMKKFGAEIGAFVFKYFNILTLVIAALAISFFVF